MPTIIDNEKYYSIGEACKLAGTTRTTLLRWIREDKFDDVQNRDRNGWRLFTESDLARLRSKVNKIYKTETAATTSSGAERANIPRERRACN